MEYWEKSGGLLAVLAIIDKQKEKDGNSDDVEDATKRQSKVRVVPPKKVRENLAWFNANFKMGNIFLGVLGNTGN